MTNKKQQVKTVILGLDPGIQDVSNLNTQKKRVQMLFLNLNPNHSVSETLAF